MSKSSKRPGVANPALASAMRGLRSSGAAGTHAQGPARERSRGASKRAAIRRERD